MCVIIHLKPNFILPYDLFETACFNNWHGYGIVLKENNLLEIKRDCPAKGNDPEKIYKILEDNKDVERFIHLRYKTEGDVDISNTQPFTSFWSDKRQVYFMHNGTLYDYRTPQATQIYQGQSWLHGFDDEMEEEPKGPKPTPSDSKVFNDTRLMPWLNKISGENGKGDIHDPMLHIILDKFWNTGSRGLLISNDQDPYYINQKSWETIKVDGGEFLASNNDYFKELKRGPIFEQRKAQKAEEEKRAKEAEQRKSVFQEGLTPIKSSMFQESYALTDELVNILEDYNLYDVEGMADLSNLTYDETKKLVENLDADNLALLFVHLTDGLKQAVELLGVAAERVGKLEEKQEKATKLIATMKQECAELNRTKDQVG